MTVLLAFMLAAAEPAAAPAVSSGALDRFVVYYLHESAAGLIAQENDIHVAASHISLYGQSDIFLIELYLLFESCCLYRDMYHFHHFKFGRSFYGNYRTVDTENHIVIHSVISLIS